MFSNAWIALNEIFNTREIAVGIIIFSFIIYVLYKDHTGISESFSQLIKAFFNKKIITPLIIMFFYSLGLVYLLHTVGLWENHQIKNYIYWLIAVGVLTHFKKDKFSIKTVAKDTISLIVIFQFLLNFYTFNLLFELIFLALIIFLTIVRTFANTQNEYEKTVKIADTLLAILGMVIIFLSAYEYIFHFDEFANNKTLYDFLVPTILSFMIIPYFYIFFIVVRYENGFLALNFALKNDRKLLKYAKLKGTIAFNFDSQSFEKWCRNLWAYDLNQYNIEKSIQDIKKLNKIKKNLKDFDSKKGWHPFIANEFLKDFDILINDYRKSYEETWSGTSNYIQTDEELSEINYRMEGTLEYVNKLEVKLFFHRRDKLKIEKSYNLFVNICNELAIKAITNSLNDEILNSLISDQDINIKYSDKNIIIEHRSFETGAYSVQFTIKY